MKTQLILSLATTLATQNLTLAQNLIDQTYGTGAGSFELGLYSDTLPGHGYMVLPPGSTNITGWTVGDLGDGVDWLRAPAFAAAQGSAALDLTSLQPGSIFTVVPTIPGTLYSLSFAAAAPVVSSGVTSYRGAVSAGSLVGQTFDAPSIPADFPAQVFTNFSFTFTATEPQTTISFRSAIDISPTGNRYGPAIDNVSVQPAAPQSFIRCSQVEICWNSVTNAQYMVQYRSELTTNEWADLFPSNIVATANETCVYDDVPRGRPQRFYRVVEVP